MNASLRVVVSVAATLLLAPLLRAGDWTWTYSVQVHAQVQASPARVTLQWPTDQVPATGYTVWRKSIDEKSWGAGVSLPGHATWFVDENVTAGAIYEYQIEKESSLYSAWGYITVGVNAPLIEARGKVLLVVDASIAGAVANELRRFERDFVGDGWGVLRRDVGRDDHPANVRAMIRNEWNADRANVRAVILFGHVPVPKSGRANVDGHGARPMPADVYYGELDGDWPDSDGNGVMDHNTLPSDMELEVGRIDFADLPGAYVGGFPGEIELLRRYLDKNHRFRHAQVRPAQRAVMGNVTGDGRGQAYAASGYRTFAALVGPGNVVESGTDLLAPEPERWISKVTANDYLWSYASGAGSDHTLGVLGTHGQYNDVWGSDLLTMGAKATFHMFFGSWISEWSKPDNFMRAALAAPDHGLTAVWSGRPHFYFHSMGSGQTIGHGVRLSQNNNGLLYRTHIQRHVRSIHIALMGDPTLRLQAVAPATNVRAESNGGDVTVTWNGSPDPLLGYRVYRSAFPGARFERISGELHGEARFVDRPPNPNDATYMVRAVTLSINPSGSHYNASQGAFSREDFAVPVQAPGDLPPEPVNGRYAGATTEVGADIRHPNGNIFDQYLLHGTTASVSADPGQVTRISFIDVNDDIVQLEFAGAGTLSVVMEEAGSVGPPAKYNQAINYMKGRAGIAITGANASTNLTVFTVGRVTALNQALFQDTSYDGVADISFVTVSSLDGRFGGIRTANARYGGSKGLVGIYASDIQFTGPILVGDLDAAGGATPVLLLGAGTGVERTNEVHITGGDLHQSNGKPVAINGITYMYFEAGTTSHGGALPAQQNQARLERNGNDVTTQVVVGPSQ